MESDYPLYREFDMCRASQDITIPRSTIWINHSMTVCVTVLIHKIAQWKTELNVSALHIEVNNHELQTVLKESERIHCDIEIMNKKLNINVTLTKPLTFLDINSWKF